MIGSKKLRQRIEQVLIEFPHCRDDDHKLIANIWQKEILERHGKEGYNKLTGHEVLAQFAKHQLSSPESIRRMRQKIQELQPVLRGNTYRERQKHQSKVKREIRAIKYN